MNKSWYLMPVFKRKRFSRRPLKRTTRRTPYKKRRYVRARRSTFSGKVYKFCRYASYLNGYNVNTTHQWDGNSQVMFSGTTANTEWDGAIAFRFSDLKNTSEFSNLFDRYMITGVRVQFQLITNPDSNQQLASSTVVQAANWFPKLWYTIDHDDAGLITRSQIQEYTTSKCRVLRPNGIVKAYVPFPRTTGSVSSGSTTVPGAVNRPGYMDMAQREVDHYGLKFAVDFLNLNQASGTAPYAVKIDCKYYFKCKDPR